MTSIFRDVRAHSATSLMFLLVWLTVWAATVATWQTDAAGHSVGMNPGAIPLHLFLPLLLGALVGWWRKAAPDRVTRACVAAGLAFGVLHCAVLLLIDRVWIPAAEHAVPPLDFWAEAVGFGVVYTLLSVMLSVAGGRGRPILARARSGA